MPQIQRHQNYHMFATFTQCVVCGQRKKLEHGEDQVVNQVVSQRVKLCVSDNQSDKIVFLYASHRLPMGGRKKWTMCIQVWSFLILSILSAFFNCRPLSTKLELMQKMAAISASQRPYSMGNDKILGLLLRSSYTAIGNQQMSSVLE